MIAAYQRISRADGDLGKDGKDKSNSIQNIPFKCPHKLILLFLIFSTITIEKSQMHSSEFGGYTSSSRVF